MLVDVMVWLPVCLVVAWTVLQVSAEGATSLFGFTKTLAYYMSRLPTSNN